jgi:predicted trehalose synthase
MRDEPRRPSGTDAAGFEPDRLADRLREIADRLRSPEVGEEEAEALAREAADLVGKASAEIESDLRSARTEEAS